MRKNISVVFGGHKDHGKSTVLGRLFWDMGQISESIMEDLKKRAKENNCDGFEYAYIMDAGQEEQKRGITINLAHKKLLTDKYSFTLADAPGHKEFIDQMEQGADESDAVVVVVDVTEGVKEQTKQHLQICHDKNIYQVIIVVNKMDLIDYGESKYFDIEQDIIDVLYETGYGQRNIIPCSALYGENIVKQSDKMDWYEGMSLIELLEAYFVDKPDLGINELKYKSKEILSKVMVDYDKPVMLFSGGKDSLAMVSLAREVYGDPLPFPVVMLDTSYQYKETYDYLEDVANEWHLDFHRVKNTEALVQGVCPERNKFECCHRLKTENLNNYIMHNNIDCVIVGIRWDEHGIRGKEKPFSPRFEPRHHTRMHPMLYWSEQEVWEYIREEGIKYNCLYDRVEHGDKIIRSIGCYPCTKAVSRDVKEERASRDLDKERHQMEQLRALGYM